MRSTKRLRSIGLTLLAISILFVAACGNQGSGNQGSSESGNQSGANQAGENQRGGNQGSVSGEPIKIGASVELTGSAAEGGQSILMAVEVAVDMINEQGGINGRPVELVVRDTEGNPTRGVSIIRDFAQKENALAVIGGYFSTVMLAQSPIIKEEEIPFMIATSNVPASVLNGMPWTFGVRMHAVVTARYTLDFLKRHFNTDKVAILYEDGGYGQGALEAMTQALEERGLKPVAAESFNLNDKDMTAQVTRARDAGAEAVYLMGIGASNGYVLTAMEKIGWKVPVVGEMGASQPAVWEVAQEAAEGVFVIQTANFTSDQVRETAKEFLDRYIQKHGRKPMMHAPTAQGFDGAMLLFNAVRNTELTGDKKKDRQAVLESLETNVGSYSGVIRDYDNPFSKDSHEAVELDSYVMNVWHDGELIRSDKQ